MNEALTLKAALIASFASGLLILGTRVLPFAVFSKRNPPAIIRFIEKYMPGIIMSVLLVYCLKDVTFTASPFGLPELISIAAVVILHLSLKNSMISIFGGTVLFMVLSRLM